MKDLLYHTVWEELASHISTGTWGHQEWYWHCFFLARSESATTTLFLPSMMTLGIASICSQQPEEPQLHTTVKISVPALLSVWLRTYNQLEKAKEQKSKSKIKDFWSTSKHHQMPFTICYAATINIKILLQYSKLQTPQVCSAGCNTTGFPPLPTPGPAVTMTWLAHSPCPTSA